MMVVDDEEFCISAIQSLMELLGIDTKNQVDFCLDGQEAIDTLIQNYNSGNEYTIIFTDFSMPIMDGISATKIIRRLLKDNYNLAIEAQPKIFGVTGHVLDNF